MIGWKYIIQKIISI